MISPTQGESVDGSVETPTIKKAGPAGMMPTYVVCRDEGHGENGGTGAEGRVSITSRWAVEACCSSRMTGICFEGFISVP